MDIETRLSNLEKMFAAHLKMENNNKQYNEWDKDALRKTDSDHGEEIDQNTSDVSDTRTAIEELYEMILNDEKEAE